MRKFLIYGLAAVMMAACSNDDVINTDEPDTGLEGTRYMAISLMTNVQNTRATSSSFSNGAEEEYAVSTQTDNLVFYFFDVNGNAYAVDDKGDNYLNPSSFATVGADGTSSTSTSVVFTPQTDGGNVTSISNLILAFEGEKGTTPAQVVALVNAPIAYQKNFDKLSTLRKELVADGNTRNALVTGDTKKYFLMSNSVYQDETTGELVTATPIEAKNIATTISDAATNPVQIYVERVDAKVTYLGPASTEDTKFEKSGDDVYFKVADSKVSGNLDTKSQTRLGITIDATDNTDNIYVKVEGWTLFNKALSSYLIKDLTAETGSPWWNAEASHRSYWANTPSDVKLGETSLAYNTILTRGSDNSHTEYALENTIEKTISNFSDNTTTDHSTGIILAAKLYTKNSTDNSFTELQLAKWLSRFYTVDNLKTAIANYLSKSLYYLEGTTYKSIAPADIEFTTSSPTYTVKVILSTTGAAKTWYDSAKKVLTTEKVEKEDNGVDTGTKTLDQTSVTTELAKVPKAQIWRNGMCYYYTPITHTIGTNTSNSVVRNHWYRVSVLGISGLGTPVWDPDNVKFDPTNPSSEDDQQWYLDAKINVLSWNLMDNEVTFTTTK